MTLTGLLVDTGTVETDFFGLAAMALIGRNETDTAMAVLNGRDGKASNFLAEGGGWHINDNIEVYGSEGSTIKGA